MKKGLSHSCRTVAATTLVASSRQRLRLRWTALFNGSVTSPHAIRFSWTIYVRMTPPSICWFAPFTRAACRRWYDSAMKRRSLRFMEIGLPTWRAALGIGATSSPRNYVVFNRWAASVSRFQERTSPTASTSFYQYILVVGEAATRFLSSSTRGDEPSFMM